MNNEALLNLVGKLQKKPGLYEESTAPFWDDDHISKMMLQAHLNPKIDAATRKPDTVEKTIKWINGVAPVDSHKRYLDLGCGPGIYAEQFYQLGYHVTGIDLSRRSIEYARQSAQSKGFDIKYLNLDYTQMMKTEKYDLITLIYCDYGVLPKEKRLKLLRFIYQSLSKDGRFIFDVFTPNQYQEREEKSNYYIENGMGFWSEKSHLVLEKQYFYENNVALDQYIVIDEEKISAYLVWDQQFTIESIKAELEEVGFRLKNYYGDLTGKPYDDSSKLLGLVVGK